MPIFLFLLFFLFSSSYSYAQVINHGYVIPVSKIRDFGNKEKLLENYGPPSLIEDNNWYYTHIELSGLIMPFYKSRTVSVSFDESGFINAVDVIHKSRRPIYKIDPQRGSKEEDDNDVEKTFLKSLSLLKPLL